MRVVIVGAGIIGLCIADELTRRGVQVELLEKNPAPSQEASWAAAGILTPQGDVGQPEALLDLLLSAFPLIPEVVTRLQFLTGIDLKYKASGMINLALTDADEKDFATQLSAQKEIPLRVEKMSSSQIRKLEPAVEGNIRWGLWWPQVVQLDNTRMVQAYIKLVTSQGGQIRTNCPVKRFLIHSGRVVGVETPNGKVEADWVINCAGSWAGFDESLPFLLPLIPVKGQILEFKTSHPVVQRVIESPRAYLVQRSPDRLLVGTTVERVGFDKAVTEEGKNSILKGALEMVPALKSLPLAAAWAGLRPGTPDHLPILGPTPWEGLLVAAGHYRNGILLAPFTGRLMADWITKGGCSVDLSPFSATRFLAGDA